MKKFISLFPIILMLILLAISSTASAGKIYRWVDSEGNVQYGERPPAGQGKQVHVPRSTPSGAVSAPKASNKIDTTNKFLESVAAERKEKKEASEKAAKEKEIMDKNCSQARRRVATLKQGGRQFEVDEKGERHYLNDADIQKKLSEAQQAVDKWCK